MRLSELDQTGGGKGWGGGRGAGGRDQGSDGTGGDALNQCACHISIPRHPRLFISLAGWLFVWPVCPPSQGQLLLQRSEWRHHSRWYSITAEPPPSDRDVLAVSVHVHLMPCWSWRIAFTLSRRLCANSESQPKSQLHTASSTNTSIRA